MKDKKLHIWLEFWDSDGPLSERVRLNVRREVEGDTIWWKTRFVNMKAIRNGNAVAIRYFADEKTSKALYEVKLRVPRIIDKKRTIDVPGAPILKRSTPEEYEKIDRMIEAFNHA